MASKYCTFHQYLATSVSHNSDEPLSLTVYIPLYPQGTRLNASEAIGSLPAADSDELFTGCCKPSKVMKFFDRIAGVVAAVRPCGIVVNFLEMFTCESPTQMYMFTFGH